MDNNKPMFIEESKTDEANKIDLCMYRIERFSDTKNAWIFVKRRNPIVAPTDKDMNLLEIVEVSNANRVAMDVYRFECFSETRGAWMFVKRRVV